MTDTADTEPAPEGSSPATPEERLKVAWEANTLLRHRLEKAREAYRRLAERVEERNRLLADAKDHIERLRQQLRQESFPRVRQIARAEGVGGYILTRHEDGSLPQIPGYALDPKFLSSRREFVGQLVEHDWARPTDRVLDVGCGIGAVAAYLVPIVGDAGSYVGVDVMPEAIAECRRHFSSLHPNFTFETVDVQSDMYNLEGAVEPGEFAFPFGDHEFDLAIMRSLFTHMLPDDTDRYLAELARILKPGGRTAITYFLLDDDARAAIADGTVDRFPLQFDGYRGRSEDLKEAAIAIEEQRVLTGHERNGFEIVHLIRGGWRLPDRPEPVQDLILARRT